MITPRLLTLQDMFGERVHYEVPIYQRPYVWDESEQWEPLWVDVRELAERRLAGHEGPLAHFLGAIVIELVSAEPGRVKVYSVIDGQQRITTLQLVLAALRDVAEELTDGRAAELDELLRNKGRHAVGDLKFKVCPSGHDRPAFQATVTGDGAFVAEAEGITGAYSFFRSRIAHWLNDSGAADVEARLDALQDTLDGLIQVVAIQLDGTSDAQVVFETLNSRGADLTSLDLVKNSLLQQARREGADPGLLHKQRWEPAFGDTDYWLEEVRQGRYTRARSDLFLDALAHDAHGQASSVQHLFADFRKEFLATDTGRSADVVLAELTRAAQTYRSFDDLDAASVEGKFFSRLATLDTTTLLPVALLLFDSGLAEHRRRRALRALESWLVRRMMLGATTQHYNRLLASLLAALHAEPDLDHADDVIVATLRGFANPTDQWPGDPAVVTRLLEQPLYYSINTRRIRLLLTACEERIGEAAKAEGVAVPPGLTVEHALPQNLASTLVARDARRGHG